jgi:DNA-binding response OmpR family regulator
MADRIVLCIEPDAATVAEIRRLLTPRGFRVESIPNGDDALEWGRQHPPVLVIVSVEPKKVGYAISNKLRKSPSMREVPLVLISGEETMATFEQHRKLKSRADEYLLKPLDPETFLAKIGGLVKLGAAAHDDDEVHELDADSDIVVADDDVEVVGSAEHADDEERTLLAEPPEGPPAAAAEGPPAPFEGEKFDPETQAAFAALEAGAGESAAHSNDMVDLRNLWSDDDLPPNLAWEQQPGGGAAAGQKKAVQPPDHEDATLFSSARPQGDDDQDAYRTGETLGPELLPGPEPQAAPEIVLADHTSGAGELDVPPSPDEIEFGDIATETSARPITDEHTAPSVDPARLRETEARNTELEARIHSLENERQTLRKEIEEARERFTQSATFSKEREFLGLREIINKKEKDILDLRDGLDAKERQILDHKDKIRELDRARRDLEESSLGFERNLVAANERVAELASDREKSADREKQLKARIDDAHQDLRRAHDEVDGLKKRGAQDQAGARMELDRVRAEMEGRIGEQEETHRAELARLNDEHAQAQASGEAARQAELLRLDVAHRAEIEALQRRLSEEQVQAGERLTSEVAKLRKEHEKTLAAAREEQAVQLASERQAYEALAEQKERDHRNEILGMRRRQEEELAGAEERRQRDIAEQEARRVAELEAAESRRRSELQSRDENAHARVTELERRHLTEKTDLTEKHRAEYDQSLARAARAEAELAARVQEIEQAYRRLAGLEADIDAVRAELGNRDVRIAQQRDRVAELEAKVADYEDQVVRAFQRIRADDKTAEKTRRALAVALALLDERAAAPTAPAPAAKPISDDPSELKT